VLDSASEQIHGADPAATSPTFSLASEHAELQRGSVLSRDALLSALDGVDAVVHLAAETGTGQSMYEIHRYVDTNVGATALLLDVLAKERHGVRRLVVASSRAVYGEGKYVAEDGTVFHPGPRDPALLDAGRFDPVDPRDGDSPLRAVPTDEVSPPSPSSVYGVTKLSQEALVLAAAPALGVSGVALRYQNVYGPGQALRNPYTGILSIFSNLLRAGEPINVFEDGLESRDFVFIDDVVAATNAALTSPDAAGRALNVGSGRATTVLEVVDALADALGVTADRRVSGDYRLGDIRHNVADLALAREALGYEPSVAFAEGIARFAAWVTGMALEESGYEGSLAELRARGLLR
jgi:dTDP-L-rhamnose 4-epimerase